jgi:hypothetical protein
VPVPSHDQLQGTLPTDLGFSTSLKRLELYGNTFHGSLNGLANISGLVSVDLHFNKFSGPLPSFKNSAATLEYISFADNLLTDSIPQDYDQLSSLKTLGLAFNKLTGNLDVINKLDKLAVIYLRNNAFTGAIPTIPSTASVVDLDNNKLSSFPADICKGVLPSAFTGGTLGCQQDWPTQDKNSCCLGANPLKCPFGTESPPSCLANCGVVCTALPMPISWATYDCELRMFGNATLLPKQSQKANQYTCTQPGKQTYTHSVNCVLDSEGSLQVQVSDGYKTVVGSNVPCCHNYSSINGNRCCFPGANRSTNKCLPGPNHTLGVSVDQSE